MFMLTNTETRGQGSKHFATLDILVYLGGRPDHPIDAGPWVRLG
jgi:hypothetical protein